MYKKHKIVTLWNDENNTLYHYILSNDEIKKGDWIYNDILNNIVQINNYEEQLNPIDPFSKKINNHKIIISDNPLLNKELGYIPINPNTWDEYKVMQRGKYSIPKPLNEFIRMYNNKNKGTIDEVLVECEQISSDTCDYQCSERIQSNLCEVKNCKHLNYRLKIRNDNTVSILIPSHKENWDRKEVESKLNELREYINDTRGFGVVLSKPHFDEWICKYL